MTAQYRGTGNDYNTKIEEMVTANSNRLIINVNDIIEFSERRVLTENHFFKYVYDASRRFSRKNTSFLRVLCGLLQQAFEEPCRLYPSL